MPDVNVKSYIRILETLTSMVTGIRMYKDAEGFPATLNEETLLEIINNLKKTREAYEQTITRSRVLHDQYEAMINEANTSVSRCRSLLYGFYGKKNPIVHDFGIRPFKIPVKKGKATQSASSTDVKTNVSSEPAA